MPDSIPNPVTQLTIEEAAAAIVRFIKEKPQTPTVQGIAALIGKPAAGGGLALTISGVAQEIADYASHRSSRKGRAAAGQAARG